MLFSRRNLAALGLATFGAASGHAQTGPSSTASHEPVPARGGTLTMIVTPEPTMMTSAFNTAGPMQAVSPKIFDGLVEYRFRFQSQAAARNIVGRRARRVVDHVQVAIRRALA